MALLIAGTHSGVGKTTVTLAICAALRQRGARVTPFKLGPDFLDPGHLAAAAGRPCANLDLWMLGRDYIRTRLAEAEDGFPLIEAMMGLHDGRSGASAEGSAAEFAREFQIPAVLVVDASAMARSLAALVKGFREFEAATPLRGVIANRVGGPGHVQFLTQALAGEPLPFLGALPLDAGWKIPERHLGLVQAAEGSPAHDWTKLAAWAEQHLEIERLIEIGQASYPASRQASRQTIHPTSQPASATDAAGGPAAAMNAADAIRPARVRMGVARDTAFCFYYEDNLRLLAAAGAELVEFSPLSDAHLPAELDGLYLGGGYPELHAAELEANTTWKAELGAFAASGRLIYAECGGLMALGRGLIDASGRNYQMAGLLPITVRMCARLRALGYREVTPLWPEAADAGLRLRGHEFHYSEIAAEEEALPPAWRITYPKAAEKTTAGYCTGGVVASYLHLHFASCPEFARVLVEKMLSRKNSDIRVTQR